jgi:hypothetical protein
MTFGRLDEPDDEIEDEGLEVTSEEAPVFLSLHHQIPLSFGGEIDDGLMQLKLPQVSAELASKRGPSRTMPVWMPPLLNPDSLRLLPPPSVISPFGVPKPAGLRLPIAAAQTLPQAAQTVSSPSPSSAAEPLTFSPSLPESRPSWGDRIDPLVVFVFYLALGAGIALSGIDNVVRYAVLWLVLLLLGGGLSLVDATKSEPLSSNGLLWGFLIGLMFGIMGLFFVLAGLIATAGALFPNMPLVMLFQSLILIIPIAETLFFRSAVQDRRGVVASIVAAGAHNILIFVPTMLGPNGSVGLVIAGIVFLTILAGVYSAVRRGYGLSAALMCQITVNLMLLFIPSLIAWYQVATRTP